MRSCEGPLALGDCALPARVVSGWWRFVLRARRSGTIRQAQNDAGLVTQSQAEIVKPRIAERFRVLYKSPNRRLGTAVAICREIMGNEKFVRHHIREFQNTLVSTAARGISGATAVGTFKHTRRSAVCFVGKVQGLPKFGLAVFKGASKMGCMPWRAVGSTTSSVPAPAEIKKTVKQIPRRACCGMRRKSFGSLPRGILCH